MNIDVSRLKESLSFLGLAISKNSSDRPFTKMIELSTENGYLYGYTDSGINNIKMRICATTDAIQAIVSFNLFYDVIKNCDDIVELKTNDKALSIKSNALKCKIPIHTSASGTSGIKHPKKVTDNFIDFSNIKDYMSIFKSIIDPEFPITCYRNIYFDDKTMVSDTDNVAIIHKQFFNEPMLLSLSSVEILSKLEECNYKITSFEKDTTIKKVLEISTDEIDITIISTLTDEYQYSDLLDLFNINIANTTKIDMNILSKAVSTSKLFKSTPKLVFDANGTSLQIESSDFTYSINNDNLEPHIYNFTDSIIKKILANKLDNIIIYFDSNGLLKYISDDIEMILSIEEVL